MTSQFRGADLLVQAFSIAGVKFVFTLSGNQILPIFDACIDTEIELIHVRHEAAAVHMADAWGRLTGEPGIALVTAGPGHANALSALYVAWAAESPLVLLSGHAPRKQLGMGAFQEVDQAEMAGHVVKAAWTATDASQLGHDLARAVRLARSGRPGPVHISLPVDLFEVELPKSHEQAPYPDDFHASMSLLDIPTAEIVLEQLQEAERPLILVGPSLIHTAGEEFLSELSKSVGIPVIGMESPRGINDPSLGALAEVLAQADRVLLLGKKLDFTLNFGNAPTFHPQCQFLQFEPEISELERTRRLLADPSRLVLSELVDPYPAAQRLLQMADQTEKVTWYEDVQAAITFRPDDWPTLESPSEGPVHPREVGWALHKILQEFDEAVFISDGGEFGQWAQACVRTSQRMINGPSGSIGCGIPFALAARLAFPDCPIALTSGDGAFGFHGMEFETAVRHQLPFVTVVGNDACWNAERQIQLRKYGPDRLIGCDLLPTRYDRVVEALGGYGEHVTRKCDLLPALRRAFKSGKPACVNVEIQRTAAPIIRRSR